MSPEVAPVVSLFPEAASEYAQQIDVLIHTMNAVSLFFAMLVASLIVAFAYIYRRKVRPAAPTPTVTVKALELMWSVIPGVIGLGFFFWGAVFYLKAYSPGPKNAYEIYVVGKQWMWYVQHPNGRREINEIHVPVNRAVRFVMVSQDVIHSLYIPAFRIKHDVLPMKYTTLGVTPSKAGQYHLFCAEYCGTKHSEMIGRVVAMEPSAFQDWLGGTSPQGSPVQQGENLLGSLGCRSCHKPGSDDLAPRLEGLLGTQVTLQGGRKILADENYIRESVLNPKAKLVANYQPVMPSYQGRVSEEELIQILSYMKSVGNKR